MFFRATAISAWGPWLRAIIEFLVFFCFIFFQGYRDKRVVAVDARNATAMMTLSYLQNAALHVFVHDALVLLSLVAACGGWGRRPTEGCVCNSLSLSLSLSLSPPLSPTLSPTLSPPLSPTLSPTLSVSE